MCGIIEWIYVSITNIGIFCEMGARPGNSPVQALPVPVCGRVTTLFGYSQAIQEINDREYLDVAIVADGEQIIVSANDIKAFPVNGTGYELVVIRITADMDI